MGTWLFVTVLYYFDIPPYDEPVVEHRQYSHNSELGTFMILLRRWKNRAGLSGLVKKSA